MNHVDPPLLYNPEHRKIPIGFPEDTGLRLPFSAYGSFTTKRSILTCSTAAISFNGFPPLVMSAIDYVFRKITSEPNFPAKNPSPRSIFLALTAVYLVWVRPSWLRFGDWSDPWFFIWRGAVALSVLGLIRNCGGQSFRGGSVARYRVLARCQFIVVLLILVGMGQSHLLRPNGITIRRDGPIGALSVPI